MNVVLILLYSIHYSDCNCFTTFQMPISVGMNHIKYGQLFKIWPINNALVLNRPLEEKIQIIQSENPVYFFLNLP